MLIGDLLILSVFLVLIALTVFAACGYPPPSYFWGFSKKEVGYGKEDKGILYYKTESERIEIDVGGKRNECKTYLLRDSATRWSKFYLCVYTLNGGVIGVVIMHFDKINPDSQLQKFLTNCKVPEGVKGLLFKERHFQALIDQIQYQPLDPAIFNGR